MWFSTFSTVYELVLGTNHTPYYPPYTSNLVSVLKDTANLHHDLIPYIRSFTYQSTQNGLPVMRAPFLELPNDKKAWGLKDEYFFGTEVLVAPIITAGGSRSVYFPTGTKYLEYFGKKNVYAGGTTTKVSLDVDSVPAYVKAGAIIPRGDIIKANNLWTKDWKPHLTIEIYPSWNVPHNTFTYWNGESAVEIIVSVDSRSRSVQVWTNGSLGVDASYAIYTKDGCKEGKLNGYGGAKVHGIETLFE